MVILLLPICPYVADVTIHRCSFRCVVQPGAVCRRSVQRALATNKNLSRTRVRDTTLPPPTRAPTHGHVDNDIISLQRVIIGSATTTTKAYAYQLSLFRFLFSLINFKNFPDFLLRIFLTVDCRGNVGLVRQFSFPEWS